MLLRMRPFIKMARYSGVNALHTPSAYTPPAWTNPLKYTPPGRLHLAQLPTPIHKWALPGIPDQFDVYIKRDDLTGSTLSGNKVRKLEFLLAEALRSGCKHVITCGAMQSNHCRATAVACTQLGLHCHLVLRAGIRDDSESSNHGNMFLNKLCGATMYFVPNNAPQTTQLWPRMEKIARHIKKSTGEESYIIPVGGSSKVGFYGYVDGFEELLAQGVADQFDDIVFACGSGGTAEGLSVSNHLSGAGLGIHGIAVCDNATYFHDHNNAMLAELGVGHISSAAILDVVEGYKGGGYGITSPEELDLIADVAAKTGIMLDPTYSGKALFGLVFELNNNPGRFKGKRILFIHTGGIFGMFDGCIDETTLNKKSQTGKKLFMWNDLEKDPFM